jgi:hypothetical protein
MRAFTVLLALVATPFLAAVSQSSQGLKCDNGRGDEHRSAQGTANAHKGACKPPPVVNPPPVVDPPAGDPPPVVEPPVDPPTSGGACVNSGSAGGTASIDGQAFVDASPWPGLQGWCVQANGPVSVSAVTDASGNYLFSGLPAGTYTVCQTVQAGWHQTFPTSGPSCPNGFGWTITVADGSGASFIWFGNLTP